MTHFPVTLFPQLLHGHLPHLLGVRAQIVPEKPSLSVLFRITLPPSIHPIPPDFTLLFYSLYHSLGKLHIFMIDLFMYLFIYIFLKVESKLSKGRGIVYVVHCHTSSA